MGNKLKITESQFNRIKNRLLETEDINSTLDYIKVGDTLIFKGAFVLKIKVTNINFSTDEVVGQTMVKQQPRKVMFKLNSYDEINRKFSYSLFDENGQNPVGQTFQPKSLDIDRGGQIVDIPGDASQAQITGKKSDPTQISKDDISEPVELDPKPSGKKDELTKDEKTNDVLKAYYKEIMSDPNLKQAFYKAPTFWNYFTAALRGKPAKGSGIYPTLKLVNTYKDKAINKEFAGFADKQNKRASFNLKQMISIPYKVKNSNETKTLDIHGGLQSAIVQQYAVGQGTTKVLINKNEGFKMVVKNKIPNAPNTFRCDFYVYLDNVTSDKYKIEDVVVEFGKSPGYEPEKTNS
jgi:hypothetical protein